MAEPLAATRGQGRADEVRLDGEFRLTTTTRLSIVPYVQYGAGGGGTGSTFTESSAASNFGTGSGPVFVFSGDLDGDGKADLLTADALADDLSFLKGEGTGSFTAAGVYAASTGNHGQSVAYAAGLFGVAATIFVPNGANPVKVASMRAMGATVIEQGVDFDEAREQCAEFAAASGGRYVHSGDEPWLIAGVATATLEVLESEKLIEQAAKRGAELRLALTRMVPGYNVRAYRLAISDPAIKTLDDQARDLEVQSRMIGFAHAHK